jgi:hypothetical protein
MSETSWILAYDGSRNHGKPPYTVECTRCGATYSPKLPVDITPWLRKVAKFQEEHSRCAKVISFV